MKQTGTSRIDRRRFHPPGRADRNSSRAFTLIEVLCVVAVMGLMGALTIPALASLKNSNNVTSSAYEIAAVLQRARTYAMTHNTYVWVGFYEEAPTSTTSTTATPSTPPYKGTGQVILGTAASLDGTSIYEDNASAAPLPASRITPIEKIVLLKNIHLSDIGAPSGSGTPLDQRPNGAYIYSPSDQYRISSDSSDATPYPMSIGPYTFYKTIRFSPSGEAAIDGISSLRRIGEIGIFPTHGSAVDSSSSNVAAVQFDGIGGDVQVYRR